MKETDKKKSNKTTKNPFVLVLGSGAPPVLLYSEAAWSRREQTERRVDNVYSRCARSVWIKNHGTNMQRVF